MFASYYLNMVQKPIRPTLLEEQHHKWQPSLVSFTLTSIFLLKFLPIMHLLECLNIQCIFTGNHACVTTINNFIPKSDVDYYCVPSGFEVEPKLPPLVAAPLHKFIMEVSKTVKQVNCNKNVSHLLTYILG